MFKKNTAVTGFPIGNFISITDGSTVTAGTPTCKRLLDGTAGSLTNAAAYDATALCWKIDLAAGDLNGDMVGHEYSLAGCLPISYAIRTTTKLISDLQDVAATAIVSSGAITTSSGVVSSVTTVGAVTGAVGSVTGSVGSVAANGITATSIATDAINAAAVKADAVTKIQNGLATPTNITAGTITTATNLTTNNDKTGYRLSATGVDDVLDEVVEGTSTLRQFLRLFAAVFTGKASGGGTATVTYRDIGDTKDRVVMTVDANGNRSAVGTRDGT